MRKIYCIIVTYNGMQWIKKCLDSLAESIVPPHTIVIDNGSKDSTVSYIIENYPQVELIKAGKNLGFGQGNNIGLRIALERGADHVFLLNQDAYVDWYALDVLVRIQVDNPCFGILSPMHLNGSGTLPDEYFLRYLVKSDIKMFLSSLIINGRLDDLIVPTYFVNAAAWLISKECLQKTGGFDPIFFHYGEDDNYAQRVIYNGFQIGILPVAKIYHDRNRPVESSEIKLEDRIRKDWIFFLNHPCDVNRKTYLPMMFRRLARHSGMALISSLKRDRFSFGYHLAMARRIAGSFGAVYRSRKAAKSSQSPPHL